jgi:hypothetical protein
MKNLKKIVPVLILILFLSLVIVYGFSGAETNYATYSGSLMSFQYPSGWNVTSTDNKTVEAKKDDNNHYEVVYLGDSERYVKYYLYRSDLDYQGNYNESSTHTNYYVFTDSDNSTLYYIFTKNGNSYEVKGLTELMLPDPMQQVIATIK